MELSNYELGYTFQYVFNTLFQINFHIAWRFIFSAILMTPFILLIIAVRDKFCPSFRSKLLGACFLGVLLPYQRTALYLSDDLFLFIRHTAEAGLHVPNFVGNTLPYDIFEVLSVAWLIGFVIFSVIRSLDYRRTVRMFRAGSPEISAAYFYRFRSRIYLPPDFQLTYTRSEQEMILAHERQHIKQHDPFLYRLLVILECACWFNPVISIAVRHFQHERELLCDQRVTRSYSGYDYGMMLLKAEKEKKTAARAATAGIVMKYGSMAERLSTMVNPVRTERDIKTLALILLTALQITIGFMGFQPAWRGLADYSSAIVMDELGLREIEVNEIDSLEAPPDKSLEHIEGMEAFFTVTEDVLTVDEKGLYDYALSIGLTEESCLWVEYVSSMRLDVGGVTATIYNMEFEVGSLKTEEYYMECTGERNWFMALTDIFI